MDVSTLDMASAAANDTDPILQQDIAGDEAPVDWGLGKVCCHIVLG